MSCPPLMCGREADCPDRHCPEHPYGASAGHRMPPAEPEQPGLTETVLVALFCAVAVAAAWGDAFALFR